MKRDGWGAIVRDISIALLILAALVIVLESCATGGVAGKGERPRGVPEIAYDRYIYDISDEWERSPWHRVSDSWTGPWYVVVTRQRLACVTDREAWEQAHMGTLFYCATGWRWPRG